MAKLEGVNIEKLQGGLNRLAVSTDDHVAYIVAIPASAQAISTAVNNAGKGVILKTAFDAEQLGINESFDANNSVNIYDQIVEFFRLAPTATLYLFNSVVKADLKAFINQNKEVKGLGLNIEITEEKPLKTVVGEYQLIVNEFISENRFIDFIHIGADRLDVFTEDLFLLTAPQISVFVACEKEDGKVSIGTTLGMQAVRKISENLGSVDIELKPRSKRGTSDYTLTDNLLGRWLNSFLPDGRSVESLDKAELNALIAKGYICAASYEGYAGYFLEDSYTCIDRGSDYAFIENNRVWNKAARIIRATLLPRVKSKVKKDVTTGFIAVTTATYWETLLNKAVGQMVTDDDISGFDIAIDHKQVVNATAPVKVKALIVADGIVHEFEVAIGLTNSI